MAIRFLHAADVHLGYKQYNSHERYNDFGRAFEHLVDDALARRVDFLLLAGDLFHERSIEPRTLLQAVTHLKRLRDANIRVIAVEGNHERPYYDDLFSWLDYLVEMGLLVVLDPLYESGKPSLDVWDDHRGAYIDLPCGARIIGARYYGGTTGRVIQDLAEALPALQSARPAYTVLMLHAGVQGILDNYPGTLSRSQLDPLRPYTDYLALGHIHKPFDQDNWIHNPGSLETTSVTEVEWDDRGYYLVEAQTAGLPSHKATLIRGVRRAFERLTFDVDAYETSLALYAALDAHLRICATAQKIAEKPVVELQIRGRLAFDPVNLDLAHIEGLVEQAFCPLLCLVRNQTSSSQADPAPIDGETRQDLEAAVLRELLGRYMDYRGQEDLWAHRVLRVKDLALQGHAPEEIIAELRTWRAPAGIMPAGTGGGSC